MLVVIETVSEEMLVVGMEGTVEILAVLVLDKTEEDDVAAVLESFPALADLPEEVNPSLAPQNSSETLTEEAAVFWPTSVDAFQLFLFVLSSRG